MKSVRNRPGVTGRAGILMVCRKTGLWIMLLAGVLFGVLFALPKRAFAASSVNDRAGLLTVSEEEELLEKLLGMEQKTGYEFYVLSISDAGGKSARKCAEDYYMQVTRQAQDHEDGAVYLIDMDNREIYVAVSGNLRYILDDERMNILLDDGYEHIAVREYKETFLAMIEDTERFIQKGIRNDTYLVDEDTGEISVYQAPRQITGTEAAIALLAGLLSFGIFAGVTAGRYRMKLGKKTSWSYKDHTEVHLTDKKDVLVNRVVTHHRIHRDPPPSSGGGGGGGHSSTVHTGSGGHSFGGGGRKF